MATHNCTVKDTDFPLDGSVQNASNYCRDPFKQGFLWCPSTNPDNEAERCNIKKCGRETYVLVPDGLDMKRCRLVTDEKTLCKNDEEFSCGNESSTIFPDLENPGECTCCSRRGCFETSSDMYEGTWRHSEDGKECLPWFESVPNLKSDNFPDKTKFYVHNYCRDPFNIGITFCFADGNGIRKDITPCGIPSCKEIASRHNYDHDCYIATDKDRSHPSLPESPTAKQLCELQPNRFFMDPPNDKYPGCINCSCCQIKECYRGSANEYNGTWTRTVGGRLCTKWADNITDPDNYLLQGENYCRDFYGEGLPYCRTSDPNVPFEECDLQTTCDGATSTQYNNVTQSSKMFTQFFDFTQVTEAYTETIITGSTPARACQKVNNAFLVLTIVVLIHSN